MILSMVAAAILAQVTPAGTSIARAKHCEGSLGAVGDILPSSKGAPYVTRISALRDADSNLVGWLYHGSDRIVYLQAGPRMTSDEIRYAGAELPTDVRARTTSISPVSRTTWPQLRQVDCPN